jgi:AcrR family transcriptional regulator
MASRETADYRRRIIESAVNLFSKSGYHGASTRDIAQLAQLNEATLFRHFPRKHDLYVAALESELQNVRLRGDLLMEVANAPDAHAALARTFVLIKTMLAERTDLIRLLQFSALELEKEFDPLLRKHIRELVEVIAGYLQRWVDNGQLQCSNPKAVILTLIAIVLSYQPLSNLFSEGLPPTAIALDLHSDISAILSEKQ